MRFILPSAAVLLSFLARGAEISPPTTNALLAGKQGDIVLLPELWATQATLPVIPLSISPADGPQFLFSDHPEYFRDGNGIALQEEVKPGLIRLYLYHVPDPAAGPKTITAVIENFGQAPLKLHFLRYAFPKPGKDYYRIGKTGLIDFFNSQPERTARTIPPGQRLPLDPKLDQTVVTRDDLVHGFYEFEIDQPARVTVFQRDPGQNSVEVMDRLPRLSKYPLQDQGNGAGRGLFLTSNFDVSGQDGFNLDTARGPMQLVLADGRHEPYIQGHDSLATNAPAHNHGNYGVLYRIQIKRSSSDGRALAVLATKRGGGKWCGAQAGAVQISSGIWPNGTVPIPSNRVTYGNAGEMVVLQVFPPLPKGRSETIEILYSPPGASCIPTPLLFVPCKSSDLP
ncbi:MAG: hypothetical protein JWR69_4101 [Pedosphaera sp.]|nr:hypothetical protein [Pedosphaera sp.]